MKKLSKLMALLLALVLFLSTSLGAAAEATEPIDTKAEYEALARDVLYNVLTKAEWHLTYRDLLEAIEESDYSEFLSLLEPEERAAFDAAIEALYWKSFVSFTEVGPFMPPVKVSSAASTYSLVKMAASDTDISVYNDSISFLRSFP